MPSAHLVNTSVLYLHIQKHRFSHHIQAAIAIIRSLPSLESKSFKCLIVTFTVCFQSPLSYFLSSAFFPYNYELLLRLHTTSFPSHMSIILDTFAPNLEHTFCGFFNHSFSIPLSSISVLVDCKMAINLLQFLLLRNEVYVPSSGMGDGLMTCFHQKECKRSNHKQVWHLDLISLSALVLLFWTFPPCY